MEKAFISGVILLLLSLMGWCLYNFPTSESEQVTEEKSSVMTKGGELITVEHDGHLFVVLSGFRAGGLVHHPDCPKCTKVK
jgi:hypothetical protein